MQVSGLNARVGTATDVRDAELIVCATTAREPLFDGSLVPEDSRSIAVGSHEPDARELPFVLIARAARSGRHSGRTCVRLATCSSRSAKA